MADDVIIAGIQFGKIYEAKDISTAEERANGITRVTTIFGEISLCGTQPRNKDGFPTGIFNSLTNQETVNGHSQQYMMLASGIDIPVNIKLNHENGSGIGITGSKGNIRLDAKNNAPTHISIMNSPNVTIVAKDADDTVKRSNPKYYGE